MLTLFQPTLPSGENLSPVHSISWLSAWSLKEENGPLSKDLANEVKKTLFYGQVAPEIIEFDRLRVDAGSKNEAVRIKSCHWPTGKLHQPLFV